MAALLEGTQDYALEQETLDEAQGLPQILVYLRDGRIDRLEPADDVELTARYLLILNGPNIVAQYRRDTVFFATNTPLPAPVLY